MRHALLALLLFRRSLCALGAALALGAAPGALPAHAAVPGQVSFQGLLLDSSGAPLTGTVTLDFSLFAATTGGTQLWSESHPGVAVQDGVYQVALGSTTPLSPALLEGGALWLEIEVDGEPLSPRQPLLAARYALRAAEAENSANAAGVNGVPGAFVSGIIEHVDWDGGNPPANDPREGVADVDGDGIASFIDPDNDGDGFSDVSELAAGSNLNLVTPDITTLVPFSADSLATTLVAVNGVNFLSGLSVQFGSENPTPQNLTATSFQVSVGPQPEGSVPVMVTNPNGESTGATFSFVNVVPYITSLSLITVPFDQVTTITVTGYYFAPGMTATVGTQSPIPYDITAMSLKLDVGPQPIGTVQVQVVHPNGNASNSLALSFIDAATARKVFVTSAAYKGSFGGLTGADARCMERAAAAGRTESYLAWIADATASPTTRLPHDKGPYLLSNGRIVAASWADLTDGTLLWPINQTESGALLFGVNTWTNVATNGTATGTGANDHCNDWTAGTDAFTGGTGLMGSTGPAWTQQLNGPCGGNRSLYCFEAD